MSTIDRIEQVLAEIKVERKQTKATILKLRAELDRLSRAKVVFKHRDRVMLTEDFEGVRCGTFGTVRCPDGGYSVPVKFDTRKLVFYIPSRILWPAEWDAQTSDDQGADIRDVVKEQIIKPPRYLYRQECRSCGQAKGGPHLHACSRSRTRTKGRVLGEDCESVFYEETKPRF